MLFNSLTFILIFLPLVLITYFLVKDKYKNNIILIFSILFYAWGEPEFIFVILGSIVLNYYLSKKIEKQKKKKNKKKILIISLIIDFGILFIFKYLNFSVEIIEGIFNVKFSIRNIGLPIGISFYTFQLVSYIVDVYRGTIKTPKKLTELATYLLFFPQLIAGPIVRYTDIKKQFQKRENSLANLCEGFRIFIIGLSKKVIISNSIALIVDGIFSFDIYSLTLFLTCSVLQTYYDFSGYSDMAIGLGKMFGFDLPINFNYPYISTSIREFWKRWHITLGSWFRDYVYIPLGGSRVSLPRWILNVLIVWTLTGIWHGSAFNYILFGLLWGIALILERFLDKYISKLPKVIRWLLTYTVMVFICAFFRIKNLNDFRFENRTFIEFIRYYYYLFNYIPYVVLGYIFMFPIYPVVNNKFKNNKIYLYIKDIVLCILFLICILFIVSNDYTPFIYFNF